MSRKTGNFLQLLTYINKDEQQKNTAIFHNLKTDPDDIAIIAQEFSENASYSPKRKNGVICYHEILSFSGRNSANISPDKGVRGFVLSPEILEDLAREYLQLRAPNALGYAKVHTDTDHPHIHFCISGNLIRQPTKNRLSKSAFKQVKEQLKSYIKTRYPALDFTLKKQKPSRKRRTPNQARGQTIKKRLSQKILEIFALSKSISEALPILSDSGIEFYQRGREALYGVIYQGKKYRLSTLGIREEVKARVVVWQRLHQLEAITQAKEKIQEISRLEY